MLLMSEEYDASTFPNFENGKLISIGENIHCQGNTKFKNTGLRTMNLHADGH